MRSDYILYAVAIIFFVITGISFVVGLSDLERNVSVVATAMLGILFAGLGFILRPKPTTTTITTTTPPPPPPSPEPQKTAPTEVVTEEKIEAVPETVVEATPPTMTITKVKGIGEKRAKQLSDLGINSVEDLSKASAKELASKLKISPKITGKWIANAKELTKESWK